MSAPVFLAEAGDLGSLAPGDTYLLDGLEGRHAGVVQRRGVGERIDVVDGAGLRLTCRVTAVQASEVTLEVVSVEREPSDGVSVVLVQALAKGDRDELAIEAATEAGVDAVLPWQAERSVVVWRGDRAAKSRARWVATVRAATKQARRAALPGVGDVVDAKGLAARTAQVVAAGGTVLVLHEEATLPIAQAALPALPALGAGAQEPAAQTPEDSATGSDALREILVVVGPEGGISERECTLLTEAGATLVRLGPHVLRTSTAGPIAVALLSERLGRWA
ncbi:16S rRNA (uracil(1498)-N(3))-methyltransferase [Sanguibacter inulinus]|uniref:Ribosomal RNA small subunit methyltransferase E n=1 Tax=Sanguibacter inulinus TaxID=60922 RepID=A0A853EP62_9MICO|nr:16S rRNA (uracil(1498)-N(3))-methyltransferase [Sanguibacter inulinus]MBF0721260.1 16S rRNA (uracil(1498)-N(3))-methyltransferase [Sanguibacter inulinus]NYS92405.1 16S rRNA (uracil(1498)-N(3))-methyltransferase [Sanguibacter inulinus]